MRRFFQTTEKHTHIYIFNSLVQKVEVTGTKCPNPVEAVTGKYLVKFFIESLESEKFLAQNVLLQSKQLPEKT